MQFFQRVITSFQTRRTRRLHEMSNLYLICIGGVSFMISCYWSMAVSDVLPDLITATNQNGLTLSAATAFAFLSGLGVTIWFYGHLAVRCNDILSKRLFD